MSVARRTRTRTRGRINDWNYVDYVRVFGSRTLQPAALRTGQHQLVYVPNEHTNGEDSFEFRASE